jgi:hypothetical protein
MGRRLAEGNAARIESAALNSQTFSQRLVSPALWASRIPMFITAASLKIPSDRSRPSTAPFLVAYAAGQAVQSPARAFIIQEN